MSVKLPLGVGFHSDIPAAVYHSDPCIMPSLSSSLAALIKEKSPAHARLAHPRLCTKEEANPKETTAPMEFGSVGHELFLGNGGGFEVWEGKSWAGKEAGAFWDSAIKEGKTPIKIADFKRAEAAVCEARRQLKEFGLSYVFEEGVSEQVAVWQDRGQWFRAMFDRWIPERDEIWDLKFTGISAHPSAISKRATANNYDLRSEFYQIGASKITGKPVMKGGISYNFLFIETEPPFLVTPCYMPDSLKRRGRRLANEAIDTWIRCMETNTWPGYVNGIIEIEAQKWVEFEEEQDCEITTSGARIL